MLVIEVYDVDTEPLQARLARLHHIFGAPIDTVGATRLLRLAELARQHDFVAPSLQCATEKALIVPPAVHVGRVEVIDALIDAVVDQRLGGCVIRCTVDSGKRHAAKSDRGDGKSAAAEFAMGLACHVTFLRAWPVRLIS